MKKYFLILIPLMILLSQCQKEPATTFIKLSGRVLELESNKPIPNAKVGIYEEGGEFLGSTWTRLLDSFRTDANGFYHYEKHNLDKGSSFFLSVAANKYITYDPNNYLITGQEVNNLDVVLSPYAWIKVHVKNVNPFNDRDSIILGDVVGTLRGIYVGTNVELNYINRVFGNTAMLASWTVAKNGIGHSFKDTIWIPAHDTLSYEILY